MNHYTEAHRTEGCQLCECKRTGIPSTEDTLLKVALLSSQHDELVRLLDALGNYVSTLSMTAFLLAIDLLVASGHVEVAGLVRHFMENAMNTSMGGD